MHFLIESALPIKELSKEARREKAIRHGHISTLHVWWARRPLVVARAAVLGALLGDDEDVSPRSIHNLCKWEVHDGEPGWRHLLDQARNIIRKRFNNKPPKVLDSFAGGGSIPLEALRLGCEVHAVEYNPVAYLILKATIEYPQRYRERLVEEVKRWGDWVLKQARQELTAFYPSTHGETPIAYIWSRTIRCPNPACGAEIPLFRQFWLARKDNKKVALKPIPNQAAKRVDFQIVGAHGGAPIPRGFDPAQGTVSRGNAVCLVCNTSVKGDYVKAEAQAGRMGHRLVAVVTTRGRGQGRNYRLATEGDLAAFRKAEEALQHLVGANGRSPLRPSPWTFNLPWVPEEPSRLVGAGQQQSVEASYGFREWGQLFNPRQLLALLTFGKWVRAAHGEILRQTHNPDFAKAVATYLALAVDKLANWLSSLSRWEVTWQMPKEALTGHRLAMVFDYAEGNPLTNDVASWVKALGYLEKGLRTVILIKTAGKVENGSAAALPFPEKHFDAVVIDPPYADNVPYADLSDFFYVWLRRTVGDLYPEAFSTTLVPKDEEAVVNPARFGGGKKGERIAQAHYRRLMQKSFEEIYRVLKPEGMAVVMFTHRSTEAWESLIQSLLAAGLYPTASWPVHTEMEASTHQRGKGAIQSTILMACRRRPENARVGWYASVRAELEDVIPKRLQEFWQAGIRGADFFISSIGPAVGVFGKYRKVMRPDGREVTVSDLLDEARALVTRFALEQLGLKNLDAPTRFYVLYRWAYGDGELSFDEANKLAKSTGAELDVLEESYRLITRKGQTVRLPIFLERLGDNNKHFQQLLEKGDTAQFAEVDRLHLALWFWHRGETKELSDFLRSLGASDSEHFFWRIAQAVLEVEKMQTNGALEEEIRALEQLIGSKRSVLHYVQLKMNL